MTKKINTNITHIHKLPNVSNTIILPMSQNHPSYTEKTNNKETTTINES